MFDATTWTILFDSFSAGTKELLNSNFITSLVGALAGAFGGAWAAQRIAERSKLRDELLKEIRNTNAAAMMAYGIANTYLGLKEQHVQGLRERFLEQKKNCELFLAAKAAGTVPPLQVFEFNADLQFLKPLLTPADQMKTLIYDQISLSAPVLHVTSILLSTLQSLNECLVDRNRLIEEWKTAGNKVTPHTYFGLAHNGVVDQRYMNAVDGIYTQTDDIIAFSITIGDALDRHAKNKRQVLRDKFRIQGPIISRLEFDHKKEFLPPSENYKNISVMFEVGAVAHEKPRLHRRLWKKVRNRLAL